jgi:hypothetical protein
MAVLTVQRKTEGGQPALDIPRQPAIKAARAKLTFLIPREGLIG